MRLDGPKAAAPSLPDPVPAGTGAGVGELRIWPQPDWNPPSSLRKGCNKDANSALLSSPLSGVKVTETLSTCEMQSLKSVYSPQSTGTPF